MNAEKTIDIRQSYLSVVGFLSDYYNRTSNDALGSILGSLSVSTFTDGLPADSAAWLDWNKCVQSLNLIEPFGQEESYLIVLAFVELYQKEFGFDLGWLKDELSYPDSKTKWFKVTGSVIESS